MRIPKATREKQVTYKVHPIYLAPDFSVETAGQEGMG
jgi:hypothetical protein